MVSNNKKKIFERDVGYGDDNVHMDVPEELKGELINKINKCLPDLDKSIERYQPTGKVPIDGLFFDFHYANNLSNLMHGIKDGTERNYEEGARFINLQLVTASKCWREVHATLLKIS